MQQSMFYEITISLLSLAKKSYKLQLFVMILFYFKCFENGHVFYGFFQPLNRKKNLMHFKY